MALRARCWVWCDGPMFIGAEVRLDAGFTAAQARLANLAHHGLLSHASDEAYHDPGAGLVRVGPLGAAPGMSNRTFTHHIGAAITDPAVSPEMAGTDLLPAFPPWPEPEDCDHNRHGVSNP